MIAYYIMKSEGDCYPITQLEKDKTTPWSGVRNYQARNYMLDMNIGDMILFYHSGGKDIGVYGLAKVVHLAKPDITAQDPKDEHYDPKATRSNPIWSCVTVQHVETWKHPVLRDDMKNVPALQSMKLFQKGSRLSIVPVTKKEYEVICKMSVI
jgi:predicted RNA-binding protein with PUA-like domain